MKNTTSKNTLSQEKEENSSASGRGILKTQTGNEEIPNLEENTEVIHQEEIEDTPFKAIGNNEQGWFAGLGKYRVTDLFETKEELVNYINKPNNWQLYINVNSVLVTETLQANAEEAMRELTESGEVTE